MKQLIFNASSGRTIRRHLLGSTDTKPWTVGHSSVVRVSAAEALMDNAQLPRLTSVLTFS